MSQKIQGEELSCKHCGVEYCWRFNPDKPRRRQGTRPKFCSVKCRRKAYYMDNREEENKRCREYHAKHGDRLRGKKASYMVEYHKRPEVRQRTKEYYSTPERKAANVANQTRMRNESPNYRIRNNLRTRVSLALKAQFQRKDNTIVDYLGCSIEQCKEHLESLFWEGMTWDNYGEWEIDHKIPCASFDLVDESQQKQCFHYSNLQPLWKEDNRSKRDRIDWEAA